MEINGRNISLTAALKQALGLIGTPDLTEWETRLLSDLEEKMMAGDEKINLSKKQAELIAGIWSKHFS